MNSDRSTSSHRKPLIRWVVASAAIWTVMGLLAAGQTILYLQTESRPEPPQLTLAKQVALYWSAGIAAAPLMWLSWHWPLGRGHWTRRLPWYVAAITGAIILKLGLYLSVRRVIHPGPQPTLSEVLLADSLGAFALFVAVAATIHAARSVRDAAASETAVAESRAATTRARLEALTWQLRPHFIFNTLNAITATVHRDAAAADRMLTELADLLRAVLRYDGQTLITLAEEAKLLARYCALMRERFGDRGAITVEIFKQAEAGLVPPFLLQPLVENAFEHGHIARGRGDVLVLAGVTNDELLIEVHDRADPGLETTGHPPTGPEGVGLVNTRSRLSAIYGDRAHLELEVTARSSVARVHLPLRREQAPAQR